MHNFRTLATAMLFGASALTAVAPVNAAAPCRNTHGQFIKCAGAKGASAPQKATASVAAQRPASVRARDGSLTQVAASRTIVARRSVAKPTHGLAASRPRVQAAHKTTTAVHPTG